PRVFELLGVLLTQPRFDSARFMLEVSNKQEQVRRQFDSPTGATRVLYYQTVYGGKLYGRYPTLASLEALTLDAVRRTYQKVYTPALGIAAISGDLTRAELEAALKQGLGAWQGQRAFERPVAQPLVDERLPPPGVYYAYKNINQTSLRLGHLTDLFENPDRHAVRIMNYAVGVGFTGRLTAKVRSEAGLAYSVGGYFVNRPKRGSYFAYCQTKADATGQALRMILDVLQDVQTNGITEEEFTHSKESILNSFVFEYETPHQVAESVAENLFYGFPADQTDQDLAALQAVTFADCQRVARQYYRPQDFRIVVVGDTAQMDQPLSDFGSVTELSLEIK
ncbi:MAG TPA: pitrilysin family protein, partial [candidate division Zixibacteria bacterium]|nr:pitrilysin family protein [candidate division Zixibacteria bacterium]